MLHPPELQAVAACMDGFPAFWCIAGGYAIDLFAGRPTRPHGDVDLVIFRADQAALRRHLAGWAFEKVAGGARVAWPAGEWLAPPVHEVYARSAEDPPLLLEFLLNERDGKAWVFRRNPAVRRPVDRLVCVTGAGLPVLCPAVVLLYKAKHPRPVDALDFAAALEALGREERRWLREALERTHPGHAWLARL